jgi:hypothetical protein
MKRIAFRTVLTLSLTVVVLAATAGSAHATRTISPTSVEFGNRQVGTTSLAQAFTLRVRCTFTLQGCNIQDTFNPNISVSGDFSQTNNCPPSMTGTANTTAGTSCTINVTFTPTSTGSKDGTLSTGAGGPTAALHGTGVTTPTPQTPPTPGPAPPTLALDLDAKKQELKKTLTFFATTNVDSTLQVGDSVKTTTKQLAGGVKTKVTAKLKSSVRNKLQKKLDRSGKAKAKIEAVATDQFGNADPQEITVKLKD